MIDDKPRSLTDREFSVEAEEFVWDEPGLSAVHALVLDCVLAARTFYKIRRVLDVGCENGAASQRLANAGFEVVGLDSSSSGIALARAKTSTVQFEQRDITKPLPYELRGEFDAVVAIEVIEHLFKPRELLRRAAESLRPAGIVILTTPYHGYLKNLASPLLGDSTVMSIRCGITVTSNSFRLGR